MRITSTLCAVALLSLSTSLAAQTQTLRGKIEDVKNTQNQFFLDCTNISLVSSKLKLQPLIGFQYVMQVVRKGNALDVISATKTTKIFDMGNIRMGRADSWEVRAPAGSDTITAATLTSLTSYGPLGSLGTFLLGPQFVIIASGKTNNLNVFQFKYQPPNISALVGVDVTAQALVQEPKGALYLTNPDCKTVRSK